MYETLTKERKLIYIMGSLDDPRHDGYLKIGDASEDTPEINNHPNSNDLRNIANKRIKQYMRTSDQPFHIYWVELAYDKSSKEYFRDYDVHRVLERSGYKRSGDSEWFKVNLDTAKRAIKAVKLGRNSINNYSPNQSNITFRPEQTRIINKTDKHFRAHNKYSNLMLWNAKMRFGKTLCALEVAKDMNYKRILIATHRPIVDSGWFDDFKKLLGSDDRYSYGSKKKGESLRVLRNSNKRYFYFVSLQDLVGSKYAGGKYNKDYDIFDTKWDLIIVDEAHEGTLTKKFKNVDKALTYNKKLLLSGTPFDLLSEHKYDDSQVCTWDYIMEQNAKQQWPSIHKKTDNPYDVLPKVHMYTFKMGNQFKNFVDPYTRCFNFDKFFKINPSTGKFYYEKYIRQFLNNITTPSQTTNYPFSRKIYRNNVRHSLWILPNRKAACALQKLMEQNDVFKNFGIVNVVKDNDDVYSENNANDVDKVEKAIKNYPYTITLTVRKLTTGVTVPQWTAVVFLSDTSSATQYLQAAFRAQSPWHNKYVKKTDCYIFDFSPERALTIAAKTVQLNPRNHGKLMKRSQKFHLEELLNFMPIVGERGNSMKPYNINSLLQYLRKDYAERAVKTGFDDDSLYNYQLLLNLSHVDIKAFEHLEGIVGITKAKRRKNKAIINDNGLSKKDYENASNGSDKPPKERTPEQKAAIKKLNKSKRLRRTMISVLRSISIRIPLMIYGMDIKFNEDLTIDDFAKKIDDKSWHEFMPNGVTKKLFNRFVKYYDQPTFVEAGRMIRAKVKAIDSLDPMSRVRKLAVIFSHFRNPDKETVLTPWRVVNMHLGRTLGGLSYYDKDYQKTNESTVHWIKDSNHLFYNRNVHILEINSKTGLYPLYMAMSLYYLRFNRMDAETAGKFDYNNEIQIWKDVLKNNIFLVAKTPMAKWIAIRTLVGYKNINVNVKFENNIVENSKKNPDYEVSKIKKDFDNVKFDVVIGNPPYQKNDSGARAQSSPVYQYFVNLSEQLSNKYVSLIIPARWYIGGMGLNTFRIKMLNDKHIQLLYDFLNPEDIFPHTNIRGGLTIFLWNKSYDNSDKGVRVINIKHHAIINNVLRPLKFKGLNIFIRNSNAFSILNKILVNNINSVEKIVSAINPFGFKTTFINNINFKNNTNDMKNPIKILGRKSFGYVEEQLVGKKKSWINKYKVFTARSNNIGTELNDDNLNTIIGKPNTICTSTYAVIGANLNLNEQSTINLAKYLKTKFSRYLISLAKSSQDATRKTYRFVPLQNFNNNSDINWNQSLDNIDDQLFKKYKLTDKQCELIRNSIADLTNVK